MKKILSKVLKNQVFVIRSDFLSGLKLKGFLGFKKKYYPFLKTKQPTQEEKFLNEKAFKDKTIYDIGGNVGIFSLFFASKVGHDVGQVITFEPNPRSYSEIEKNKELNNFENLYIEKIGLGRKREDKKLFFREHDTGTGSMESGIKSQIEEQEHECVDVEVHPLDSYAKTRSLPMPDFIKIDVEGMEYDVLLGMKKIIEKHKPQLFIEIHGLNKEEKIKNIKRIVAFLQLFNYLIYHVESNQNISGKAPEIAKEGHIFCKPRISA